MISSFNVKYIILDDQIHLIIIVPFKTPFNQVLLSKF